MSKWKPKGASRDIEEKMEAKGLPESDRDEVRKFAEFLQRRKKCREGEELPPAPEGMREWLEGKE